MLKSKIEIQNGIPSLFIDGQRTTAMAYTTYFEERSCYRDFINAGYRIFFVNVSFTTLPINPDTGFSPFHVGVFDDPANPDYSEFENAVHKILLACPDAVIFPRIYVSMPQWWVNTHPDDVDMTKQGDYREVMFSKAFRKDGEELLIRLIRHIKASDYAHRIGGWMLCGGLTQEWIYRNYNGNLGAAAQEPYRIWIKETYGIDHAELPAEEEYNYEGSACQKSENAKRYSIFCNLGMANSLDHFSKAIKQETNSEQVVGAFYGYTFEAKTALFGSYALRILLDSPNLDFFSSPNAYTFARAFGMDWADMMPVDSIKKHGKLCFIECDIRTYLTTGIQKARPGEYPDHIYTTNGVSVWSGPPTAELSREALRKSFAHQITKASALWWFDMWGGWYHDPILMEELTDMKKTYDTAFSFGSADALSAEVVFFADEQSYANLLTDSPQMKAIKLSRTAMGKTGAPYDSCMVEDADSVLKNYKAAVFPFPLPSEVGKHAMDLCKKTGIPYLCATSTHCELTVDDIREFYKSNGIHLYTEENDVVYVGSGYLALHSAIGGVKRLYLPGKYHITPIFGTDIPSQTTDNIVFHLKDNATALFSIT